MLNRHASRYGRRIVIHSDVLVVNRVLRHVPGARGLAWLGAWLDDRTLELPGLGGRGTQVVGVAVKD